MRVLVTGGAGYIGSHAVRELARSGYDVVIYDNLCTGHALLADGFDLVRGDIGDSATLMPVLKHVDAVMHFAAHAHVAASVNNPRKYFENNVQKAISLLDAVLAAGVATFVFSSTCAVYGIPQSIPITEDVPRQPVNPYGATKLCFEHALEAYDRAYGLRFASLRYFNAAGADESGAIGEIHDPETHLIPAALMVAAGLRPHLKIYGTDYSTPDGTCIRDYIHVSGFGSRARSRAGVPHSGAPILGIESWHRGWPFDTRSDCHGRASYGKGIEQSILCTPSRGSSGACGRPLPRGKSSRMESDSRFEHYHFHSMEVDAEIPTNSFTGAELKPRLPQTKQTSLQLRTTSTECGSRLSFAALARAFSAGCTEKPVESGP